MAQSPEELGLAPDLSRLPIEVRDLIRRGNCGQYPSHSEAAASVCVELLRAGYGVAEIFMILSDPANSIFKEFFSQDGGQAETWLERIVYEADDLMARKEPST